MPKLVEDLLQTSISTGPRGAFRMAQGIQAVLGVGGEWLNDLSKVWLLLFYTLIFFLRVSGVTENANVLDPSQKRGHD